jgi:alginate O-acetyltransferase complex protein AlgI
LPLNSAQFLIFVTVTVVIYYSLPHRHRNVLLLAASYIFYLTSIPGFLGLIIITTLMNYYIGKKIGATQKTNKRKTYLITGLIIDLGLLLFFKYFNFFNDNVRAIFDVLDVPYGIEGLDLLIPMGISFYILQILSYLIDVYRKDRQPEQNLLAFALYGCFFPIIDSGPIERSTHLLPQFHQEHPFNYQKVREGCLRILWGLFKKMVIADRLAVMVNEVYQDPAGYAGLPLIVGTIFFAIQIYLDFSGYTDIAIGVGKVLGFDLIENFNLPYLARSITEFWKRWHISLTSWLRDYIYFPLTRNRIRKHGNSVQIRITDYYILAVFLISGFWHGANWTFIAWGALHGLYLLGAVWMDELKKRYPSILTARPSLFNKFFGIGLTFTLVTFSWIFFRADSLEQAFEVIASLFKIQPWRAAGLSATEIALLCFSILFTMFVEWLDHKIPVAEYLSDKPLLVRWACYVSLTLVVLNFSVPYKVPFIYVQF